MKKKIFVIVLLVLAAATILFWSQSGKEKPPLRIAVTCPITGGQYTAGKSFRQGVKLYIDQINKAGGVNGRKILQDIYDDQNDPDIARQMAEEIVRDNRALAVIGHFTSACSIPAGEIYKNNQIPAVTPSSTNILVTQNNKWYFRTVFNNKLQARFLANYIAKVFPNKSVSIIYEDDPLYSAYLADVFEETARSVGLDVKYVWRFQPDDENLDRSMRRIVYELQTRRDAGAVFLAAFAENGSKLVRLMKDTLISNPVIAADAMTSRSFQESFAGLPKEIRTPGYYTNGMYAASHLIFDTATQAGQAFKDAYREKFREEPDWIAAFAYDTAMVITHAIANSGVADSGATIREDRAKIRDYLAGLDNPEGALEGATGLIYFDENGDCPKPVYMGIYQNKQLISALTQFRPVANLNEIPDLKEALAESRVLLFDGRYTYKTNVVYTGIDGKKITDLDLKGMTCTIDFFLWFRYQGEFNAEEIEFLNADEPIELGPPVNDVRTGQINYRLFHVKGRFKIDVLPGFRPLAEHFIGVSFSHKSLPRSNLIYVIDVIGMRLTEASSILEQMKTQQVLNPEYGWKIDRVWFSQGTSEKKLYGNPKHLGADRGTATYSRFNAGVYIKQKQFSLRRAMSFETAYFMMIFSLIMTLLIFITSRGATMDAFAKTIWAAKAIFLCLLLLSSEVVILDRFKIFDLTDPYFLDAFVKTYDVLWWVIPAFLLSNAMGPFVWAPMARRSGQIIPDVLRRFVAFLIYCFAFVAVIVFVFDQNVTKLMATSGLITLIIGLAIQSNIANLFAGIVINQGDAIRIGDWVKIGGYDEGRIVDITWRETKLETRSGSVLSIPNSAVSDAVVNNYNFPDNINWVGFTIHIDPVHPPDRIQKILDDALLSAEGPLKKPRPSSRFRGFSEWSAVYSVGFCIADYSTKIFDEEAVWKRIWRHLNRAGVYPAIKHHRLQKFQEMKTRLKDLDDPHALLSDVDIFAPVPDDIKKALGMKMRSVHVNAGDMIVRQGDEGSSMFIISEGVVEVRVTAGDTEPLEIVRMGAGSFFGEMALLTGEKRTATVIAVTDTRLFEIGKPDIAPLMIENPQLFDLFTRVLARRKTVTDEKIRRERPDTANTDALSTNILSKIRRFFGFD